jgi:methionyl aminopeptidase
MIIIKNEKEIERMRISGRLAAQVLRAAADSVAPGMTTADVEAVARETLHKIGGRSAFLGYRGYPGLICISLNEEIVHGIPGPRRITLGDVVSIDVGVEYDGYIGDTATTVLVGVSDPAIVRLYEAGRCALDAAMAQALAGRRIGDISHATEAVAIRYGFSVVRDFVGHGVGRSLHEDPAIPNYGPAGRGPKLRPGMTLAIEPMLNLGKAGTRVLEDGWTAVTMDGRPSVHFEHTVAVTESTPLVLTML